MFLVFPLPQLKDVGGFTPEAVASWALLSPVAASLSLIRSASVVAIS